MGSKTIIFLGVLLSALYLYFSVTTFTSKTTVVESDTEMIEAIEKAPILSVPEEESDIEIAPVIHEENEEIKNVNERISIPAFGFMSGVNKSQIVALMSDNDENGSLVNKIETLCQKVECSKDMRFENDIKDAHWQEDAIKIIDLLVDEKIENGSLFIEGNILKLEGTVVDKETEETIKNILENAKSDTFKIENFTKLSPMVVVQEQNSTNDKSIEVDKIENREVKTEESNPTPIIPVKSIEPKKSEPVKKSTTKVENEQVENKVVVPIQVLKTSKPINKTTTQVQKQVAQKVVKPKPVPKVEIVPEPVMETTLDAESRVRKILKEIKNNTPESGMVANPAMDTTVE